MLLKFYIALFRSIFSILFVAFGSHNCAMWSAQDTIVLTNESLGSSAATDATGLTFIALFINGMKSSLLMEEFRLVTSN